MNDDNKEIEGSGIAIRVALALPCLFVLLITYLW